MSILFSHMPSGLALFCALLSVLIPYAIYKINAVLHKIADAPWCREQGKGGGDS
ncbi:hypothetical protein [Paenibacillus piri]|uniref:hypothetical protein n=1 Tax=Paenibacillus piri TaxID=2547395 RepID=UPI001404EE6B|nr:hypothetical protein [Paenibacillus piri]